MRTGKTTLLDPVSGDPSSYGQGISDLGSVLGYSFVTGATERVGEWDRRGDFQTYFVEGTAQVPTVSNQLLFNVENLIVITQVSAPSAEVGNSYIVPSPGVRLNLADLVNDVPATSSGPFYGITDLNDLGEMVGSSLDGDVYLLEPIVGP